MATVSEIFEFLDGMAPCDLKLEYDNVGLLVGRGNAEVSKILVALDITDEVVKEAESFGSQLIVSHHPVIFTPLLSVCDADAAGERLLRMIEGKITAICMHTNLDIARGGVNDALAGRLGLKDVEILFEGEDRVGEPQGLCRAGGLETQMTLAQLCGFVSERLSCGGVRFCGDPEMEVRRVCVAGGSGGGFLKKAKAAGCDVFITSDLKHSQWHEAAELGLCLIDAGHFSTEDVICPVLVSHISNAFPGILVKKSETLRSPYSYYVC